MHSLIVDVDNNSVIYCNVTWASIDLQLSKLAKLETSDARNSSEKYHFRHESL